MLELYNKNEIADENKRKPEDIFSGDGETKDFAFYNLNADILTRVFLEGILKTAYTDFYTYWIYPAGSSWLSFFTPPTSGSNNVICQSDECMFFPGGTAEEGSLNGYAGDTVDIPFYLANIDVSKIYTGITITPVDFLSPSEITWVKMATTQGGLSGATAGAALSMSDITDNDLHVFWVRITVPPGYLAPDVSIFNKTDIAFSLSFVERDA